MRSESGKIFISIRTKMVLIYLAVTLLTLLAISFTVAIIVETSLVNRRTKQQREATTRLALELSQSFATADADALYATIYSRARQLGGRVMMMDRDAVVQMDSASIQTGYRLPYKEVQDVLVGGSDVSHGFHRIGRSGGSVMDKLGIMSDYRWAVYYTAPITQDGVNLGAVLYSTMIQDVEDSVKEIVTNIAITSVAVAAVMAVLCFMLTGFVTKPIVELTNVIRKIGRQSKGGSVKVKGKDEVAELGRAFNRMREQIEDHDRVRDEFVSNASHELKTPLATMKLLSESILYEENPDPAEMREFFEDVNHEVDRMSNVITDLLRLVQFDEGEPTLNRESIRLDVITKRVAQRLLPLAQNKGITLKCVVEQTRVAGEETKLEQAVVNLIENAIKYTDEGSVDVSLRTEHGEAVLRVKDTGIGIPEDALGHIFERFYRVDKARSRGTGGTGLGLAIVERIIAMHGGYINVESKLNKGSLFAVHLPVEEVF